MDLIQDALLEQCLLKSHLKEAWRGMRQAVEGMRQAEEDTLLPGEGSPLTEVDNPQPGVGRHLVGEDKLQAGMGIHPLGEGSQSGEDIQDNSFFYPARYNCGISIQKGKAGRHMGFTRKKEISQ